MMLNKNNNQIQMLNLIEENVQKARTFFESGIIEQNKEKQKKHYEGAIKCCDVVLEQEPNHINANMYKAGVLNSLGYIEQNIQEKKRHVQGAIKYYDVVLEQEPNHINTNIGKAKALNSLGYIEQDIQEKKKYYAEAMNCYDVALKQEPNHIDANTCKAQILINLGTTEQNIQEKKKYYTEAMKRYNVVLKQAIQPHTRLAIKNLLAQLVLISQPQVFNNNNSRVIPANNSQTVSNKLIDENIKLKQENKSLHEECAELKQQIAKLEHTIASLQNNNANVSVNNIKQEPVEEIIPPQLGILDPSVLDVDNLPYVYRPDVRSSVPYPIPQFGINNLPQPSLFAQYFMPQMMQQPFGNTVTSNHTEARRERMFSDKLEQEEKDTKKQRR